MIESCFEHKVLLRGPSRGLQSWQGDLTMSLSLRFVNADASLALGKQRFAYGICLDDALRRCFDDIRHTGRRR